ncbi:MAG: HAMP domain-containing histidine kinase [Crocinitomicaceae bacterium]|nr:HAMP domain-containing histidine kinase [Crocinitomicaceae bacterium]
MNLYSKKQRWKIALLIFALLLVGASLFVSNNIVSKVGERERERARQWADAIKKKIELVRLTNSTFSQLRDKEREKMTLWIDATKEVSKATPLDQIPNYDFPLKIINGNKDIPVILLDNHNQVSGNINLDFDTSDLRLSYPNASPKELNRYFEDSLLVMARQWQEKNPSFTIEVYEGLFMTYCYNDSKGIAKLENERDSLINAFNEDLINNDGLVPVLLIDNKTKEIVGTNIDDYTFTTSNVNDYISQLKKQNEPIAIDFKDGNSSTLYFDDSSELKQLQYFPYIQFLVIGLFAIIGYLIFSTFRKAEQNKVWAGMAKETAHQLGTPLSSLMAWVQLLESQGVDKMVTVEMQKDVDRLEKVTDRFSKIGSGAKLDDNDISTTVSSVMNYLRPRISDKVEVTLEIDKTLSALHNASLIEWVVENIAKNAVDAMEGKGKLDVKVHGTPEWVYIDIKDNGKGIPSNQIKTIFEPGFSTKKRGWGLGLSLVKRIVKEYHKGNVSVLESQQNVGTTFRISIPSNIL